MRKNENRAPRTTGIRRGTAAAAVLLLALVLPSAIAQDEPELGWSDQADLSLVITGGNSESETIGFKNKLERRWERALLEINAGGLRAESTTSDPIAIGSGPTSFSVDDQETTDKTAEAYFLNGRYNRKISDRFFWYAGAGWDRNRFAGIENRYVAEGGVGNVWYDTDKIKFHTNYGVTYTDQEDVIEDPTIDDSFAGVRFSWGYKHLLTETTTYTNELVIDGNLDESDDYRADMYNSIAVAMNSRLALKLGLRVLYDNLPALEAVPLFDTPGGTQLGTVLVELDDVDTIFTASLVVNF
jgi:hypothetical protein